MCGLHAYANKVRPSLVVKLPPPSSNSFFSNGRIRIPNLSTKFFVTFFQHYPAKAKSCTAKGCIHTEQCD